MRTGSDANEDAMTDAAADNTEVRDVPEALESLLPARMLQPGETIVLQLKPSPLYILIGPAGFLLLVLTLAVVGVYLDRGANAGQLSPTIALSATTLVGLRLGWQFLDWLCKVYVLTDRRVIRVQGVVRVHAFESPLESIRHTNLYLSLRERLAGLGTITFSTAGTGGVEAAWIFLANPLDVHAKVVELVRRSQG